MQAKREEVLRRSCRLSLAVLLGVLPGASESHAQATAGPDARVSVDAVLGRSWTGHEPGVAGKLSFRIDRRSWGPWGIGFFAMAADGARRRATDCVWWCDPIESFTEIGALVHRRFTRATGTRFYVGAGIGRLSGRRFVGTTADLEDVSELIVPFDVTGHFPIASRFGFALGFLGHVGPEGISPTVTGGFFFGGWG